MGEEEGQAAGACVCGRRTDQRRLRERGVGGDPVAAAAVQHRDCGRDRAEEKERLETLGFGTFSEEKEGIRC